MRTARLLTIFQHALRRGGVCPPGGCLLGCLPKGCLPKGCLPGGVCLRGVSASGMLPSMQWGRPPPRAQRDTCESITFSNFSESMHKICQFCIFHYSRNTRLNGYSTHSLQQQYLLPHSHIFCILHLDILPSKCVFSTKMCQYNRYQIFI